ncbi:SGNH/GDSL hydrolase family protein [Algibacter amylolyticus]|uniref:SGNH/GDSL hydrolase family protein n=1 Tax=Algibacter amylolyticus TaxID=1608400 RepID=A0A5M7BGM0_9FLAO|nr:SGNH/GDSL hydrolase family protein [Algibacter amylolyticus]KAA5827940.1 SGNH/GDSL hydrolase family protein [Algibacter amylolyticus]MBB5267174.1 lysophospholipase L1-like esterase [Algibacter amylolyticus]TSJ82185.1 SGNH/GDSL hydrolase family protein [Algibacter amylolyticus]
MKLQVYFLTFLITTCLSCSSEPINSQEQTPPKVLPPIEVSEVEETDNPVGPQTIKYLALGDSYTIGQSVCETCRYPEILKRDILKNLDSVSNLVLSVIATTGWTTTDLINAITNENPSSDFDLVTLLIGVNNQYQNIAFNVYQSEFPKLVNTAIAKAKGNKEHVIVVSIPDYAYTPFGRGNTNISADLDRYNTFAKNYCDSNNITYVNITDITRQGLENPNLVANDGLHPSELAYSMFVERLLPVAIEKLKLE